MRRHLVSTAMLTASLALAATAGSITTISAASATAAPTAQSLDCLLDLCQ